MPRVRLLHWKASEVEERAARLAAAGYEVDATPFDGPAAMKALRQNPPDALVIDLSHAPSAGRDVAAGLRHAKSTSRVPLVFVEGDPEKVERTRSLLPDAVYTSWSQIRSALKRAIAQPPTKPVRPASALAGYSGTPLPKKLGIKSGFTVTLVGAPDDFEQTLGPLPDRVQFRKQARGHADLIIWFTRSAAEIDRRICRMADITPADGLWIAWPKKSSGVSSDLTQRVVRKSGLDNGLVDYKICSIDATWTGLKFARRK